MNLIEFPETTDVPFTDQIQMQNSYISYNRRNKIKFKVQHSNYSSR